jgi:hypothetical protein
VTDHATRFASEQRAEHDALAYRQMRKRLNELEGANDAEPADLKRPHPGD